MKNPANKSGKGPYTPREFPGHVSSNRKPFAPKSDHCGPRTTKPNFSPKVRGDRLPNHSTYTGASLRTKKK